MVCVEERQANTAGFISWHDPQNSGVEVRTMVTYDMLNRGKAITMPMAIKMAGLMAFFQKGFLIAESPALAMAPPNVGSQIIVDITLRKSRQIKSYGDICIL